MSRLSWPDLDWRQPWAWPQGYQRVAGLLAMCAGAALTVPLLMHVFQRHADAQGAVSAHQQRLADTQALQQHTAQLMRQVRDATPHDAMRHRSVHARGAWQAVIDSAHALGLQTSQLSVGSPVAAAVAPPSAPASASLAGAPQHSPFTLHVQGAWSAWHAWVARWPDTAPAARVVTLQMRALPQGGLSASLVLWLPQLPEAPAATSKNASQTPWQLAAASDPRPADAGEPDPLDAPRWVRTQRAHAQQHPSVTPVIASEFQRPRQALEAWPRDHLHYVGHIAQDGHVQALVHASDSPAHPVYRVRLGDYLGQDLGRVEAITDEGLRVRELLREPSGAWLPREVMLPLEEVR